MLLFAVICCISCISCVSYIFCSGLTKGFWWGWRLEQGCFLHVKIRNHIWKQRHLPKIEIENSKTKVAEQIVVSLSISYAHTKTRNKLNIAQFSITNGIMKQLLYHTFVLTVMVHACMSILLWQAKYTCGNQSTKKKETKID